MAVVPEIVFFTIDPGGRTAGPFAELGFRHVKAAAAAAAATTVRLSQ
jgi:hypothetical protein